MADIPGVPLPDPPKRKPTKRRVTTSKQWIERGPLAPWMYHYAQWLAEHPGAILARVGLVNHRRSPPTQQDRTAQASRCARRKITRALVVSLERRADFVDYFEKLRADAQFLARELLRGKISKNLEARDKGLDMAVTVSDHKAIEHYTRPFVELGFPKKAEKEDAAPRITINIGSADAKTLLAKVLDEPDEVQDVEYEVIEPHQLTDGDGE